MDCQEPGEPSAIGSCPLDADTSQLPEFLQPLQSGAIAGGRGGEELHAELPPTFVERSDDVDVAVGVDPARDSAGSFCHRGHGHPFIASVGGGRTSRDGGQDRDGAS